MKGVEILVAKLLAALKQHDAAGCAELFTEDACLLSPFGPEAHGRNAIAATHEAWFEAGETNKCLELLEAGVSGNLGYCTVAYAGDYPRLGGSTATERGKSVNVLKRQADGEWKIHVSCLVGDVA